LIGYIWVINMDYKSVLVDLIVVIIGVIIALYVAQYLKIGQSAA